MIEKEIRMETYSIKLLVQGSRGIFSELYIGNLKFLIEHNIGEALLKKSTEEQINLKDILQACKESKEIEFIGRASNVFMKCALPILLIDKVNKQEIQEFISTLFGNVPDKAYIYSYDWETRKLTEKVEDLTEKVLLRAGKDTEEYYDVTTWLKRVDVIGWLNKEYICKVFCKKYTQGVILNMLGDRLGSKYTQFDRYTKKQQNIVEHNFQRVGNIRICEKGLYKANRLTIYKGKVYRERDLFEKIVNNQEKAVEYSKLTDGEYGVVTRILEDIYEFEKEIRNLVEYAYYNKYTQEYVFETYNLTDEELEERIKNFNVYRKEVVFPKINNIRTSIVFRQRKTRG